MRTLQVEGHRDAAVGLLLWRSCVFVGKWFRCGRKLTYLAFLAIRFCSTIVSRIFCLLFSGTPNNSASPGYIPPILLVVFCFSSYTFGDHHPGLVVVTPAMTRFFL